MIKIWIFLYSFFVAIQCLCSSFVFLSIDNLNTIFLNGYRNDKNLKLNTTIISLWEYIHLLSTQFAVYSKVGMVYFLPLLLFFSPSWKTRIERWASFGFENYTTTTKTIYNWWVVAHSSNEFSYFRLLRETTEKVCTYKVIGVIFRLF